MYSLLLLFVSFSLVDSQCNYTIHWFNENHPWDSQSNGNDIERFSLIQAKYPSFFEFSRWTGYFDVRIASSQTITDKTILIESYTRINDGFICHAINGKQCVDYEIGFCLQSNPCSVSMYPPDEEFIVSGREARSHSLPWHASIQYDGKHTCEGTLIDDQHVLTSASCLRENLFLLPYSVILGAHYLSNSTDRISIDSFKYHSDYNIETSENNIALIKLNQRVQSFTDRIIPACLDQSIRMSTTTSSLLVASWYTVDNTTGSISVADELRQTILTRTNRCSRVYQKYDSQKQLCVGQKDSKDGLCQIHRGHGLFEKQKYDVDRWILIGIANYGCQHTAQGYPNVYTRISAYYDWIQKTIEEMK